MAPRDGEDVDLWSRTGLAVPGTERDDVLAGALRAALSRHAGMSAELARLVDGFRGSPARFGAAELAIPDLLADGEQSSDQLAEASGADASALYRLLRALASL